MPRIKRGDRGVPLKLRLPSLRSCIRLKYLSLHPPPVRTVTRYGQPLGGDREPGKEPRRCSEPAIPVESTSVQSLLTQRKSGESLGLPLRGRHAELPAEVDRSTTMAAFALLPEARGDAAQTPRWDSELLPDQGSLRRRRSYQR